MGSSLDLIESCRRLVHVESTPSVGNSGVVQLAQEMAQSLGFVTELQSEFHADLEHINLFIRTPGAKNLPEILLQSRLDTVDPGPFQLWKHNFQNPFALAVREGELFGLGVLEGKADFLCKLLALDELYTKSNRNPSWKLAPVICVTGGFHAGMIGTLKLIRKNKVNAKMALVSECTDLSLVHASLGHATFEIRIPFSISELKYRQDHDLRESSSTQSQFFSGSQGHAIRKLFEFLRQLPENIVVIESDGGSHAHSSPMSAFLEFDLAAVEMPISQKLNKIFELSLQMEKQFINYKDSEFDPGYPTLNLGMIRTFEDHVLILGSTTMPPSVNQQTYESWMENIKKECEQMGASFRVRDYKKPFRTLETSGFLRACQSEAKTLRLKSELGTQNHANECSLFARIGLDCLAFGPGKRTPEQQIYDDHVSLTDLQLAQSFYTKILERFCL